MPVQAAFETNFNYGPPQYGAIYASSAPVGVSDTGGLNIWLIAGAAIALFLFLKNR